MIHRGEEINLRDFIFTAELSLQLLRGGQT